MAHSTLYRRQLPVSFPARPFPARQEWRVAEAPSAAAGQRASGLEWVDLALICIFILGLYTNFTVQITPNVPFPSAPSGIAGLLLLWRRRNRLSQKALACLLGLLALYLLATLSASDVDFLRRRTNGLIQLTYSITIAYAVFLTAIQASHRQIGGLFLGFALVIAVGCLLETYGGLRPVSDAVRKAIYSQGVYDNDLRDTLLYRRTRPKFFASEPSSVTFSYALLCFLWVVISRWRWKLVLYLGLVGIGLFAMPGPTLLLMLVLLLPYMLFLASRKQGRLQVGRFLIVVGISVALVGAFWVLAHTLFPVRLEEAMSGNDPSFFYRVRGPALAGLDVMKNLPFAGAGLTGEPFVEQRVTDLYVRSPAYSAGWQVVRPASELLINYFWLHWIYLGLIWGLIITTAVTVWLRLLGVPSVAFCWMAWAILGQASGAYVGPLCWAVLLLSAAAATLHQRQEPAGEGAGRAAQHGTSWAPIRLSLEVVPARLRSIGGSS